jgi:hypothetical protein
VARAWAWALLRAGWAAALLVLASAAPVLAHPAAPARVVPVTTGGYRLLVAFYDDAPRAGSTLWFSVEPAPGTPAPGARLHLTAQAVPAFGVPAAPVPATVGQHDHEPLGVAGQVILPVGGSWTLRLYLDGPLGNASAGVPLQVAAPPAIPRWLGWAVALIPVWGLLGFLLGQVRGVWRAGDLSLELPDPRPDA